MANASTLQSSFLGGEWSKAFQGRADHKNYPTALATCLNSHPIEEGAWVRRSGTQFCATTRSGKTGALLPFTMTNANPYTLEFTAGFLRFYAGNDLVTDPATTVVSLSTAKPAVLVTSGDSWASGDQIRLGNIPSVKLRDITVTGSGHTWTLTDAVTGAAIDGSQLGSVGGGVTASRIVTQVTPYTAADLPNLRGVEITQSTQQLVIFCATHLPQVITATPGTPYFTFSQIAAAPFLDGPYIDQTDPGNAGWLTGALSGSTTFTCSSGTAVDFGGFDSRDIGRLIRIRNEPPVWDTGATYHNGDQVSYPSQQAAGGAATQYYTATDVGTGGTQGDEPDTNPAKWPVTPAKAYWVWATITGIVSPTEVNITFGPGQVLFFTTGTTFVLGLICKKYPYPSCGTYYGGRLWMGGSLPNRFDASRVAGPFWFAPTDAYGTVNDDDAMDYTLDSSDQNTLLWLLPDHLGLVVGTAAGEWLIQSTTLGNPITPTSIQAYRGTKYGCAFADPVRTGISIVFIQKFKRRILEWLSDVFTGKFIAPNLSQAAKHLAAPGIAQVVYQEETAPIIWARCDDGSLIGCTYRRVSAFTTEEPAFVGWHHHSLGGGRTVVSLAMGPSADGLIDALKLITTDSNGLCHVETLTPIFDEDQVIQNAWFVDNGVVPSVAISSPTGVVFQGLWHLEGTTVSAWIGALDCGDYPVSNGQITVPFGAADGYFTMDQMRVIAGSGPFSIATVTDVTSGLAIPAVIGYTYTSQAQQLRGLTPPATGAQNGPALGKKRRIQQFAVLIQNVISQSMSFGTRFDRMYPLILSSPGGTEYTPVQSASGVFQGTLMDDESYDGMLCWQVSRPYPAMVCAVGQFVNTVDK